MTKMNILKVKCKKWIKCENIWTRNRHFESNQRELKLIIAKTIFKL